MSQSAINDELRLAFDGLADVLIPAYKNMPAASTVGVSKTLLDRVLAVRPDLKEDLVRGLRSAFGRPPEEALNLLHRQDHDAFEAISLAAAAGYYMDEQVRELISYPGQELIEAEDPYALQAYVLDGALERVFQRGPIYVPTPGVEPKAHSQLIKKA